MFIEVEVELVEIFFSWRDGVDVDSGDCDGSLCDKRPVGLTKSGHHLVKAFEFVFGKKVHFSCFIHISPQGFWRDFENQVAINELTFFKHHQFHC